MTQSPTRIPKANPAVQSDRHTSSLGLTLTVGVAVAGLALFAAACGSSGQATPTSAPSTTATSTSSTGASATTVPTCPSNVAQGSPGVTAHNVNVAAVATLSGPLAGDF